MSINSWTNRDVCDIKRETVDDTSGEAIKEWTLEARGELPASAVKCRIQEQNAEEATACGVRAGIRSWNVYFGVSGDPRIDTRDRIFLVDESEIEHECLVIRPSKSADHQNRLWKVVIEELGYAEDA